MTIHGTAKKIKCSVCESDTFHVYKSETELTIMVRCADCEKSSNNGGVR